MNYIITRLENIELKAGAIKKYLKKNPDNIDIELLDHNVYLLYREFNWLLQFIEDYKKGIK